MVKLSIYISYFFLIFNSFEIYYDLDSCPYSFSCKGDFSSDVCLVKTKTNSPEIFDIALDSNFNNSYTCDVHNAFISDSEKTIFNQKKSNKFLRPSYINGSCDSDSQCLVGICKNNKCITYSKCYSHEQCPLNTFCYLGKCIPLLEDGSTCDDSFQCKFNSFCNIKVKKCQKLFSIKDNSNISGIIDNNIINFEEICQTGGYAKYNKYLYCRSLYNINYECDENDKCLYFYISSKGYRNEIKSSTNCLCGFNKSRKKNCILANGEQDYINYLNIRKDFLFNESYIKKCHTLERNSREICNELINTDKSVYFRNFVQNYNNLKIKALEFHRIKDSEPCVKEVIFGYDTNSIIPLKQQCPRYSCNDSLPTCLFGANPFNDLGNNINIELNSKICSINEHCSLSSDSSNNQITSNDILKIMSEPKITGTCSIYTYWPGVRYPGEACNIDSDCISDFQCIDGVCSGFKENQNCTDTYQCEKGCFCSKETLKCTKQRKEGEKCQESWDCHNYLGCYRNRCIKLGILKPGVINTVATSPFPGNDRRELLCTTGEMDLNKNYCVENKYDDEWITKNNKIKDENGFIKCDYDEICYYDNGKNKYGKKCGCGYNNEGQGYCPLPSNINKDVWNERIKNIAIYAKNDCHSLSRYECYLQNSINDYKNKKKFDKNTIEAHLFYKAVPCAEKMFSQNRNIHINYFILGIFSLIFI